MPWDLEEEFGSRRRNPKGERGELLVE